MELSAEEIDRNKNSQYFKAKIFEYPSVGTLLLPEIRKNWHTYFASECFQSFKLRVDSVDGELPATVEIKLNYYADPDSHNGHPDDGLLFHFLPQKDRRKNAKKFLNGKYKVELLNSEGVPFETYESSTQNWLDLPETYPYEREEYCIRNLGVTQRNLFRHLGEDDPFIARVTFTQYVSKVFEYPNQYRLQEAMEEQDNALYSDMSALLSNAMDADVKITTKDGMTFPAHKLILKSRVPMYKAMFETDMMEKDGLVNLPISSRALQIILSYIYTGKLHKDWKRWRSSINEVLFTAGQYELKGMLRYYDKMLITLCNDSNADDLLCIAKTHELKQAEEDITKWQQCGNVMMDCTP